MKLFRNGVIALVVFILLLMSTTIVPAGHTGVRVAMGRVTGSVGEGLAFKLPFVQSIITMDNRVTGLEMHTEAVTNDLQAVSMTYTVNYSLNNDMSASVFQSIGTGFESIIIRPTVEETVKDITARYSIEQLITERARVSADISTRLQEVLGERGFTFARFNITDFSFSDEFSASIEQVRIAEQNALKAQQDLVRIEVEAQQRIAEAHAEAEAYRIQSQQLTDNMVRALWIEAWDGKLPQMHGGDGNFIVDLR